MKKERVTLSVNGQAVEMLVDPNRTLLQFLREDMNLTGAKHGCGVGDCGACTVLMDGEPVNSCLVLAVQADGHDIITIEGLASGECLHPIQQSFVDKGAIQCGFCSPGMILVSKNLLENQKRPSEAEVRQAISGNLCRCTGYQKIVEATLDASRQLNRPGQRRKK